MKKLINDPARVVPEMLEGLVALDPRLALLDDEMVVVRADIATVRVRGEVTLISGGGSGHEPAHAGYVGAGMLSAAVCGDVFTSPSTDAVLAAIRAVAGLAGVLLIVKNYTGDRLNFGLAAELARAEGIAVEMMIVADDVALADSAGAGRRGIAGTVLVHKVAGAAAASGLPLGAVRREAEAAAAALGTMGVALSPCTVPAAGRPGFALAEDEIELGLGIHGEAGVRRSRIAPADVLVDEMLGRIIADRSIGAQDRVALLVNNLGGTPAMELAIIARRAVQVLEQRGVIAERVWCGTFLTALEMAGCSLSLLTLDDQRRARLDAPADAPAWPARPAVPASLQRSPIAQTRRAEPPALRDATTVGGVMHAVLLAVAAALKAAEPRLTALDQAVGDGDLGISLARGAAALERELSGWDAQDPAALLRALAATVRRTVGGTSGPLYAAGLLRAAAELGQASQPAAADWAAAFSAACDGVAALGGAVPGERTMLDALYPAAETFRAAMAIGQPPAEALRKATDAARAGAAQTANMAPRRGRSAYLGARALGTPDPGAEAVVVWLDAFSRAVGA